jgi:hypothetical protein
MPQTYEVGDTCPVCGGAMLVTRLSCGRCGSALEGAFHVSVTSQAGAAKRSAPLPARGEPEARFGRLARLNAAQLEFVETFLRCRGVIKNVEDMLGISYPTVRARLNNVLEALGFTADEELPAPDDRLARREILGDLAAGRITTEEAHQLLQRHRGADDDDADSAD